MKRISAAVMAVAFLAAGCAGGNWRAFMPPFGTGAYIACRENPTHPRCKELFPGLSEKADAAAKKGENKGTASK